jgi:hypothetical protein
MSARLLHEIAFQAKVRYLAFKRMVWLFETLVLLILGTLMYLMRVTSPKYEIILAYQILRVTTEVINHYALSQEFNAQDRWKWLFPLF